MPHDEIRGSCREFSFIFCVEPFEYSEDKSFPEIVAASSWLVYRR